MWIERDLSLLLRDYRGLEAAVVLGPRQVGKTSLLVRLFDRPDSFVALDDLQLRERARRDPALLLADRPLPVIIDEFQHAPDILSELKLRIDTARRGSAPQTPLPYFLLSGSDRVKVNQSLRETLAGRVSIFSLHGLSVHEITRSNRFSANDGLWRGGFPELYNRPELDPVDYLNDYISTFVEKDVGRSAGVTKLEAFLTVTRLLAARVGQLINYASLANDAGVAGKTIGEWVDLLERARIVFPLPVYSSNINSRLIKTPKLYFLDTGLAVRLQGHLSASAILGSPQAGSLFENLVVSEVVKARDHFKRPWQLYLWRTKEGEEIDLIVEAGEKRLFIESKLAIQGAFPVAFPASLRKTFGEPLNGCVVTYGGKRQRLDAESEQVPIAELTSFLLEQL